MWDRLGKRFDRRAKKNTDLIKVKYALPAMWVIILDLCINPFFLATPVELPPRAAPASTAFPHTPRIFLPSHIAGDPPRDSAIPRLHSSYPPC